MNNSPPYRDLQGGPLALLEFILVVEVFHTLLHPFPLAALGFILRRRPAGLRAHRVVVARREAAGEGTVEPTAALGVRGRLFPYVLGSWTCGGGERC